jgi:hypothetical protein
MEIYGPFCPCDRFLEHQGKCSTCENYRLLYMPCLGPPTNNHATPWAFPYCELDHSMRYASEICDNYSHMPYKIDHYNPPTEHKIP